MMKSVRAHRAPADWPIYLALVIATLAVYIRTANFDFVNFDDPDYVVRNPHVRNGLTADNIGWAFTSTEAANWFPLTRISHLLDVELFGVQPGPEHLVNASLHALAALLLFAFLKRATAARWLSAFTAAVFALHPLHVESVAWIAERKDVLCAVFWFLSLWAYVRWAREGTRKWYALSLGTFCCGWMAKPMIVTLPLLLLLIDVWPLGRAQALTARLREKIPFFAVSIAGAAVTFFAQSGSGAVQPLAAFPLGLRVENALVSACIYLARTFDPSNLAVFYPYPASIPVWQAAVAAAVLVSISVWSLRSLHKRPWLAVGWWWFIVTLLPVIGLVQAGAQARADRYTYVPMIGICIMLAWSARELLASHPRWAAPIRIFAAAALTACAALAWVQTGYWQNSGTLFRRAIAVTGPNSLAEHNLGAWLLDQPGELPDAVAHLQRAVDLNPASARAHTDLATALAQIPGRQGDAVEQYRAAVRIDPDAAIPHNNLANLLAATGQIPEAVSEYQAALRLDSNYAEARANLAKVQSGGDSAETHYNLGIALSGEGRPAEAVAEFEKALRIHPNYAEAENNLGVALTRIPDRAAEAMPHFRNALRLRPDYADAHYNLGVALANTPGHLADALLQFQAALRLHPDPELRALVEKLKSGAH